MSIKEKDLPIGSIILLILFLALACWIMTDPSPSLQGGLIGNILAG